MEGAFASCLLIIYASPSTNSLENAVFKDIHMLVQQHLTPSNGIKAVSQGLTLAAVNVAKAKQIFAALEFVVEKCVFVSPESPPGEPIRNVAMLSFRRTMCFVSALRGPPSSCYAFRSCMLFVSPACGWHYEEDY
jgi:hypothetical protein